jgi:hypothetical protein
MSPAEKKTPARVVSTQGPKCLILHNSIVNKSSSMIAVTMKDPEGEPGVTIYLIQKTLVHLRDTARIAGVVKVNALSKAIAPIGSHLEVGEDLSYQTYYEELQKKTKKLTGSAYAVPMPDAFVARQISGTLKELNSQCAVATDSQLSAAVDLLRDEYALQLSSQNLKGMFTAVITLADDDEVTPEPKPKKGKKAKGKNEENLDADAGAGDEGDEEDDGTSKKKISKKNKKAMKKEPIKDVTVKYDFNFSSDEDATKDEENKIIKSEDSDGENVEMYQSDLDTSRAAQQSIVEEEENCQRAQQTKTQNRATNVASLDQAEDSEASNHDKRTKRKRQASPVDNQVDKEREETYDMDGNFPSSPKKTKRTAPPAQKTPPTQKTKTPAEIKASGKKLAKVVKDCFAISDRVKEEDAAKRQAALKKKQDAARKESSDIYARALDEDERPQQALDNELDEDESLQSIF